MAIAKMGSRRIVVDSKSYRWAVRSRPTYAQALAQSNMTFVVVLEAGGRSTLVVQVDAARPDNWMSAASGVISPSVVERAIRKALRQGWSPAEQGGAYELGGIVVSSPRQLQLAGRAYAE